MVNCRKVSHLLSAYIDSELPGVEYRMIREHLVRCPDCTTEYEGLLETKRLLARLRVQAPRGDLPRMILSDVRSEESRMTDRGSDRWVLRGMAIGATAAVIGLLCLTRPAVDSTERIHWIPDAGTAPPPPAVAANPIAGLAGAQPILPPLPIVSARERQAWPFPASLYRSVAGTDAIPLATPSVFQYTGLRPILRVRH
jgi:anti-sigma factor RsiW